MLEAEPRDAIDIVFTALGTTNGDGDRRSTTSSSRRSGMQPRPDLAVLLPPFGTWHPPGRIDGERCARARPRHRSRRRLRARCSWCAAPDRTRRAVTVPIVVGRRPSRCRASIRTRASTSCASSTASRSTRRLRPRRVGCGGRLRPARGRAPDRRRLPNDAGPRAHARGGADPVRAPDRDVPGRSPPARRRARGDRGARGDAAAPPATSRTASPPRSRRRRPDAPRRSSPTNCQQVLAGHRLHHRPSVPPLPQADDGRSKGSSDPPTRSRSTSGGSCSPRAACRR